MTSHHDSRPTKRQRRSWYRRRLRRRKAAVALACLAFTCLGVLYGRARRATAAYVPPAVVTATSNTSAASPEMNGVSAKARPVFPYSVVNGGVRSREELEAAIKADPLVRDHYRGFKVGEARVLRLSAPIIGYVSFRKDGKIYWTHRPLEIRAGEQVLSDGKKLIRARCGNQISIVPMRPTTHFEPKLEALNVPEPQLVSPVPRIDPYLYDPSPPLPPSPKPEVPPPPKPRVPPPPLILPPLIAVPNSHTPRVPITPEPSTWLLMGTGVALVASKIYRRSK